MTDATTTFDAAAAEYEQQLQQGISLSGESADYFVEGRVRFVAEFLQRAGEHRSGPCVMDFGCGVGNACRPLQEMLGSSELFGLDPSPESLSVAKRRHAGSNIRWTTEGATVAPQSLDLVYTSGVFHHIDPRDRAAALERIFRWLKPGGHLALFENNPWNPGTRWVMSRIPFDRDAQCLSILESRRRVRSAGFDVRLTRALFFFPRPLQRLRWLERGWLSRVPLGAQYVVVAQRPQVSQ